jgi:hypothetical protein
MQATFYIETLHLAPGLGRHVEHDERSRQFALPEPVELAARPVRWQRRSPIFDQGRLGSCTGNAAAGWLATDNTLRAGGTGVVEADAIELYSRATRLDRISGNTYPPADEGSSGLGAAKALVQERYALAYHHGFSVAAIRAALQSSGPLLIGMTWLTGCDKPDGDGVVRWTGTVRGGHEVLLNEDTGDLLGFDNSWGPSFGVKGRFYMPVADFTRAMAARGDAVMPR